MIGVRERTPILFVSVVVSDDEGQRAVERLNGDIGDQLTGKAYAYERAVQLGYETVIETAAASEPVPFRVKCHPRNDGQVYVVRRDDIGFVGRLENAFVSRFQL